MKEERYRKIVKWKKRTTEYIDFSLIVWVFIWITVTKVMNSWYFNLFEYALLGAMLLGNYKRTVTWRKIK